MEWEVGGKFDYATPETGTTVFDPIKDTQIVAKVLESINESVREFISEQHMFFVATAPSAGGHVNLSPKGYDCFRVLSPHKVAYLDLTGSGNETSAHLSENGRITLMWCAFKGAPNILRLYGTGRVLLPDTPEWDELIGQFNLIPGARQLIVTDIDRVQTSCGFSIPYFEYAGERETLIDWAEKKGADGLEQYHAQKNVCSIDGLVTPLGEQLTAQEK